MISLLKSKFDIFNHRTVFLSADKLTVYHWIRGKLGGSYLFDIDEQGQANFERYLQETPNYPVSVVVDVIEEEYRLDTIPHVFGSDRRAVIKRKESRMFRDSPYCFAEIQGREEQGRKDDNVLFMSLSNPEIIRPWMRLLDKHKVPLSGIHSLSLIIGSVLGSLPYASENALVVSLQSISGLRQTYFQKNKLKISRLAKMPRYGTTPYAPKIIEEVEKVQRYLNSLNLISMDKQLDIYFLVHGELLDELNSKKIDSAMINYHVLDIDELGKNDGMTRDEITPFSDQFLIHHFMKRNLPNCYASESETRYFKMRKMRHALNTFSMIMILCSAIFSGFNLMESVTLRQQSGASVKKADFYNTRYQIAREGLPVTPVEAAELKTAVEIARTLDQYKTTPVKMFKFLSDGLDAHPDIKLDSIEWMSSVDPNKNMDKDGGITDKQAAKDYKYYQIAMIEAHMEPFEGNYRQAIDTVDRFAETLRNNKIVYDVNVISFPLDISSNVSLGGDTRSVGKEAKFTLQAIIGIANET
jgi:hypothetical protein